MIDLPSLALGFGLGVGTTLAIYRGHLDDWLLAASAWLRRW